MKKEEKIEIFRAVRRLADGKRIRMKAILEGIEREFSGIALICVDKDKDTVLWGFEYMDDQEALQALDADGVVVQ